MRFPMAILACRAALPLVVVYSARYPSKALVRHEAQDVKLSLVDAQEVGGQIWTRLQIERAGASSFVVKTSLQCQNEDGVDVQHAAVDVPAPFAMVALESLHAVHGANSCRLDVSLAGGRVHSFCLDKEDGDNTFEILKTCF